MNAAEALAHYTRLASETRAERQGSDPRWLADRRSAALDRFAAHGFPTRRQEAWRYTSLDKLLAQPFALGGDPVYDLSGQELDTLSISSAPAARLVFCDGRFIEPLSHTHDLPEGVLVSSLRRMLVLHPQKTARHFERAFANETGAFDDLNTLVADDGLWIEIAPGVELDKPIEVVYTTQRRDTARLIAPRNRIIINAGARARLVEHYTSLPDAMDFTNSVTGITLAENAQLDHYRLQNEGRRSFHKSALSLHQESGSRYHGIAVSLGGDWSRTDYQVRLGGEQADCTLNGLYITGDQQLSDFHIDVEHAVPACSSTEHFKGILLGASRAVFDGRVQVAAGAQKTSAHLKNDNLLLSRNAEIDTKPLLEIFADDVQCSHGTTVGQIEDQQLFYLRSRGIDEQRARSMLCSGFAREILLDCAVPGFTDFVTAAVEARL